MLKIWNDHHSSACVRFRDRGMGGLPVQLYQSTGATIFVQGSRDLFLLYITIWCDIQIKSGLPGEKGLDHCALCASGWYKS